MALLLAGLVALGVALGPDLFQSVSAERKIGEDVNAEHRELAEMQLGANPSEEPTIVPAVSDVPGLIIVEASPAQDGSGYGEDQPAETVNVPADQILAWETAQLHPEKTEKVDLASARDGRGLPDLTGASDANNDPDLYVDNRDAGTDTDSAEPSDGDVVAGDGADGQDGDTTQDGVIAGNDGDGDPDGADGSDPADIPDGDTVNDSDTVDGSEANDGDTPDDKDDSGYDSDDPYNPLDDNSFDYNTVDLKKLLDKKNGKDNDTKNRNIAADLMLVGTPTPTISPIPTNTPIPTETPTPTSTPTPTNTPTPTPTNTPTPKPTKTPTPKPTKTPTPKPTKTPTPKPTKTPTPSPTPKPTSTPTPSPTPKPTATPTSIPSPTPTPVPDKPEENGKDKPDEPGAPTPPEPDKPDKPDGPGKDDPKPGEPTEKPAEPTEKPNEPEVTNTPTPTPQPSGASKETVDARKINAYNVLMECSKYIGLKYVSGGNSLSKGTDCSGFVKLIYAKFGISLQRSPGAQMSDGYEVSWNDAKPGDLVCTTRDPYTGGGHSGIYIGVINGRHVYLSQSRNGSVHVSSLTGEYLKRYKVIRVATNTSSASPQSIYDALIEAGVPIYPKNCMN